MSGLPPELVSLLDGERKRRMWCKYLPLWGGGAAVGLAVGIGPSLLRSVPTVAAEVPPKVAVQTALDEKPTVEDREWRATQVECGRPR